MTSMQAFLRGASKKSMDKLGSTLNPTASAGPGEWSKKLMASMGWKKGDGLGKEGQGIKRHVTVKKKDNEEGIGYAEVEDSMKLNGMDHWDSVYSKSVGGVKLGGNAADSSSSDSESDSDSESESSSSSSSTPSKPTSVNELYQSMFEACGGRRPGRRASRPQPGKWARAETDRMALPGSKRKRDVGGATDGGATVKKTKKKRRRKESAAPMAVEAESSSTTTLTVKVAKAQVKQLREEQGAAKALWKKDKADKSLRKKFKRAKKLLVEAKAALVAARAAKAARKKATAGKSTAASDSGNEEASQRQDDELKTTTKKKKTASSKQEKKAKKKASKKKKAKKKTAAAN